MTDADVTPINAIRPVDLTALTPSQLEAAYERIDTGAIDIHDGVAKALAAEGPTERLARRMTVAISAHETERRAARTAAGLAPDWVDDDVDYRPTAATDSGASDRMHARVAAVVGDWTTEGDRIRAYDRFDGLR